MKRKKSIVKKHTLCKWLAILVTALLLGGCGKQADIVPVERVESTEKPEEVAAVETPTPTPVATSSPTPSLTPSPSPKPELAETPETFVLYLSGIDVWGALETQSRSDVNMLVAVNQKTGKILLVNTPRDYYVELPISNGMRDKLTHAGIYGVDVSRGAMEMLYDVPIEYYARLNFSGFEAIIDALGGIDVYSEYDFTVDPIKHYEQGMNHLTGLESLAFVRERKSFEAGDVQRGINQMEMVRALFDKLFSFEAVKNFEEVYTAVGYFVETNMDKELILSLVGNQIIRRTDWEIETYYVTGSNGTEVTYSMPGTAAYVMWPNESEVAEGTRKLKEVLELSDGE